MSETLTILFLESSKNFGGQERRILHEAQLLSDAGHLPVIVCPKDAVLHDRAEHANFDTYGVQMRNAVQPSAVLKLCSIVLKKKVDIIYAHSGKDATLGGICGALTGIPLIRSRELLTPVRHASSYNLFPKRVLACSEAVREQLISSGVDAAKVFVQYPPVSTKRFEAVHEEERLSLRHELGLAGRFPVILCVAGFRPEKRQEDLLLAMPAVAAEYPKALLLLAGSGKYADNLAAIARKAGVEERVVFAGEREDVPVLLKNADIYVLPSSIEPFGMGPVEAMAAGVPVIVTRTGGLAEIVTDGINGLLVPVIDPCAITSAILRICKEPGLRDSLVAEGRKRAMDFDEQKGLQSLLSHFRKVVGKNKPV